MVKCKYCGQRNKEDRECCWACGAPLECHTPKWIFQDNKLMPIEAVREKYLGITNSTMSVPDYMRSYTCDTDLSWYEYGITGDTDAG